MLPGGLHIPQTMTSAKFRGQTGCFMGQNQVQLSIWDQGLLPMKRHRKIVNANVKHKRASRSPTLLYASTPALNS